MEAATKLQIMHSFFSGFGLTAYEENCVPANASFPYLTYSAASSAFDEPVTLLFSIWYREKSWHNANAKAEEISTKIGMGGMMLPCAAGAVWITRNSPFAQSMGDPSDSCIKRKIISITAEFMTAD